MSSELFLTNPQAVKVYNENNEEKKVVLIFSKPIDGVIYLIIVGKVSQAVIQRIEMDASVGFAIGYLNIINKLNSKNPKSFFIKKFPFQEYEYAYKEVIELGMNIATLIYKEQSFRAILASVYKNPKIDWGLDQKETFVTVKESEFTGGNFTMNYWQKSDDGNYIIPEEASKIWTQILINDSEEGTQLAQDLYKASNKRKKKRIREIIGSIESLLRKNES